MNKYSMMAESYRSLLEQGKIDKETADKYIKVYEFLAACDRDDFYIMVDSSAFNDIIRAYLKEAVEDTAEIEANAKDRILEQLDCIFDERITQEVMENYLDE